MSSFKIRYRRLKWFLTPPAQKKAQMDAVLDYFRSYGEAQDMLKMAQEDGVKIRFSAALIGTSCGAQFLYYPKTGKKVIELRPDRSDYLNALSLVHELRHHWQGEILGKEQAYQYDNPRLSLMLIRIQEADAYTFQDILLKRVTAVMKAEGVYYREATSMLQEFRDGDQSSENFKKLQTALNDMQEKHIKNFSNQDVFKPEHMALNFKTCLQDLKSYDREVLSRYHLRYTTPFGKPRKKEKPADGAGLTTARMREFMRVASNQNAAPYLADLSDRAIEVLAMRSVHPRIRKTMKLMERFEKAAASGALSAKDNKKMRREIDRHVDEALKLPTVSKPAPKSA